MFRITREPWQDEYSIAAAVRRDDGRLAVVQAAEVRLLEEGEASTLHGPMLRGADTVALQSLMDQLWSVGIRPSDIGTPGHLSATQAHLQDMRKLVEKSLDVKL